MNETSRSNSRQGFSLAIPLALIIGILIGLFTGWYVWPVEWEDGTLEVLGAGAQEDVLRAYIDSFSAQPDETLALARYNSLGSQKSAILARIWNDPEPLNPIDIQAFATAVGASAALGEEAATSESVSAPASGITRLFGNSLLTFLLACMGLLLLAIIGIALLARRRPPQTAIESAAPILTEPLPVAGPTSPTEEVAAISTPPAAEGELPDWLQPAPDTDPYTTVRLEEQDLARVFESEEAPDLGATPPQGLYLGEIPAADQVEAPPETDDLSWLNEPASDETSIGWRDEPVIAAETPSTEPTPEELAPFELDVPVVDEEPASFADETSSDLEDRLGVGIFDLPSTEPLEVEPADIEETPEETFAKFSRDISTLEGIGAENAEKLRAVGITVPLLLLKRGADPEGRRQIAADTGISEDQIYRWVCYIDLFRIKGVGQEYAEMLVTAGAETVEAVGQSDPTDLHERLRQASDLAFDRQRLPSPGTVEAWVAQAKKLPRSVT